MDEGKGSIDICPKLGTKCQGLHTLFLLELTSSLDPECTKIPQVCVVELSHSVCSV